ncbi:MAG: TraR/DksA C4-type zinc finger protein [Candidatus Pacebacteria bacterium]|nr:TraR/DksA C4-type zinc finger protein [Candidatus Paceibacterota bacterium]
MVSKQFLAEQEKKLDEAKKKLEAQLSGLAQESEEAKGEWEPKITFFNAGTGNLEEEADEVEEFSTNLALSQNLEEDLENVNLALAKIKKGNYGLCEKCGKLLPEERLRVYPQARYCTKCG